MKSAGTFVAAAIVVTVALLFPSIEPVVEALAAIAFVAAIAWGFALHPRRDVFYIRTTTRRRDMDRNLTLDHDQLAVRVETARLWLLFLPTSFAVGFLVVTSANGTLWHFSFVTESLVMQAFGVWFTVIRVVLYFIAAALWIWVSERRVLRDADACSARLVKVSNGRVQFQFNYPDGDYGGGDDFYFGLVKPYEAASLIFFNVNNRELCKIGMGFLFHRVVVIGRGLPDLDHKTVAIHSLINEAGAKAI